jgi:hypothetical protein
MTRHAGPLQTILMFLQQGTEREHVAEIKTIETKNRGIGEVVPRIHFCLPQLSLEFYVEFLLAAKGRESEKEREKDE